MIALVHIDDGRPEYLFPTIEAVEAEVDYRFLIDDSGDPEYARGLEKRFPEFCQVHHERRRGLAATVLSAWSEALRYPFDYLLHWEGDFLPVGEIPIAEMISLLEQNPHLAQVVLKRQAWRPEEIEAGGFIELYQDWHTQRQGYVEQQLVFSLNPCLIPRHIVELLAPGEGNPEVYFTQALVGMGYSFAILGEMKDDPRVIHIGSQQAVGRFV